MKKLEDAFETSKKKGRISTYSVFSEEPESLQAEFDFRGENLNLETLRNDWKDFERYAAFYQETLSPESRKYFGPPERFLPPHSTREDREFMIGQFPNYVFTRGEGGVVVAHFFLRKFGVKEDKIDDKLRTAELGIGIADSHQGTGMGSLAMDVMEFVGRARNLDAIWLINFVPNIVGARLYEHKGYEVVDEFMKHNAVADVDMLTAKRLKIL